MRFGQRRRPKPPHLKPAMFLAFDGPRVGPPPGLLKKEEAGCCMSRRDAQGRPPIGFCGPDCQRLQERDRRLADQELGR